MTCRETEGKINLYIQGELTGAERTEFVTHIRRCKSCFEELEIYYTINLALKQLDDEKETNFDIHRELKDSLKAEEKRSSQLRVFHMYHLMLEIIAVLVILIVVITQFAMWIGF